MKPCRQVKEAVDGVEAGRDMKRSLKAIQYTNEQTTTVQGQLKEVNSALVEINKSMTLLRMQNLKAIQYTSEQTMTAQGQLKEVNSTLVEIKRAMALLRMQLQPSG